jgi:hypothetical protein
MKPAPAARQPLPYYWLSFAEALEYATAVVVLPMSSPFASRRERSFHEKT